MAEPPFRTGMLWAAAYIAAVLAVTTFSIWVWPRLGPWFWAHF